MKRLICFFVILFLFQWHCVYADECSVDTINSLKKVAEVIQIDSEFDYDSAELGNYGDYIVSVYGITEGMYVMTHNETVGFYYDELVDGYVTKTVDYKDDILEVYSESCPNTLLRKIDLSLKKYNPFSKYEECNGIDAKDLAVCGEFYDKDITYEQFVKMVNEYRDSSSSLLDSNGNSFMDFIKDNYILVISVGGIIVVILIVILAKWRSKHNRLD